MPLELKQTRAEQLERARYEIKIIGNLDLKLLRDP
jgi:hypothetical protein